LRVHPSAPEGVWWSTCPLRIRRVVVGRATLCRLHPLCAALSAGRPASYPATRTDPSRAVAAPSHAVAAIVTTPRDPVGEVVNIVVIAAAGDYPDRLHAEASFGHLCGVAPLPARSGRTGGHRLKRGGGRAANNAPHPIVLTRLRHNDRTRDYTQRRRAQGLSPQEITRCLKPLVAKGLQGRQCSYGYGRRLLERQVRRFC
jgi:Transposase IS116/IS110/IS902 family